MERRFLDSFLVKQDFWNPTVRKRGPLQQKAHNERTGGRTGRRETPRETRRPATKNLKTNAATPGPTRKYMQFRMSGLHSGGSRDFGGTRSLPCSHTRASDFLRGTSNATGEKRASPPHSWCLQHGFSEASAPAQRTSRTSVSVDTKSHVGMFLQDVVVCTTCLQVP